MLTTFSQLQRTDQASSHGTRFEPSVTSCAGSNTSSGSDQASRSSRIMLQRWIDETPHEAPYVAFSTINSVNVQRSDNMEEDQEIAGPNQDR